VLEYFLLVLLLSAPAKRTQMLLLELASRQKVWDAHETTEIVLAEGKKGAQLDRTRGDPVQVERHGEGHLNGNTNQRHEHHVLAHLAHRCVSARHCRVHDVKHVEEAADNGQ